MDGRIEGEKGRTEIGLVNVLDPIGKESIRDDEKVELHDETSLARGVAVGKPFDVVPFPLDGVELVVGRHCAWYRSWTGRQARLIVFKSTTGHRRTSTRYMETFAFNTQKRVTSTSIYHPRIWSRRQRQVFPPRRLPLG